MMYNTLQAARNNGNDENYSRKLIFLLELDFRRISQELLVFSYITGNDIRRALLLAEACYDRK